MGLVRSISRHNSVVSCFFSNFLVAVVDRKSCGDLARFRKIRLYLLSYLKR